LNATFPGFSDPFEKNIIGWRPWFQHDTYITCLSEHRREEDPYGRLSMWRAFGTATGVAIVLNNTPFLAESITTMGVWSSPVEYLDEQRFSRLFAEMVQRVEGSIDFLKGLGPDVVQNCLFSVFRAAALCTKHPGFEQEKEWRVVHSPRIEAVERIVRGVETVRGVPQLVCKIPLGGTEAESVIGMNPDDLVERIIIGPQCARQQAGVARNEATLRTQALLEDQADDLVVHAIAWAKRGDTAAPRSATFANLRAFFISTALRVRHDDHHFDAATAQQRSRMTDDSKVPSPTILVAEDEAMLG
jgi:hypothetical protein